MDLDVFERWGRGAGTLLARVDWLQMLVALLVVIAVRAALGKGLELVGHRMARVAQRSSNRYDDLIADMLSATRPGMLTLFALLVGLNMLDFGARWDERLGQLWFIALALQAGLWGQRLIRGGLRLYGERHAPAGASTTLLSWALRTLLWSVLGLAVFSNLGIDITAFVASLGIGGIAVALAAQNILGDLFASLSIAVDKPFEVGDSISVGAVSGTVERVGLKTTRIRSINGEQIVMSNTDLLRQTVSNFKRQQTADPAHRLRLRPDLRRHARAARRGAAAPAPPHRGRPAARVPPRALQELRRELAGLRGGLHRARPVLRRLHGPPAGAEPGADEGARRDGAAVRLSLAHRLYRCRHGANLSANHATALALFGSWARPPLAKMRI